MSRDTMGKPHYRVLSEGGHDVTSMFAVDSERLPCTFTLMVGCPTAAVLA